MSSTVPAGIRIRALLLSAVGMMAAVQGWAQTVPKPDAVQQAINLAPVAKQSNALYTLRTGDEIEIRAFNIPQLNQAARVRPDGKISLVLLNDVDAAGLTAVELGTRLSLMYGKHDFREPRLTVVVVNFPGYSVYVGGEVGQPAQVPLTADLTVVSAIIRAGGFREGALLRNIILLRNSGQGAPVPAALDIEEVIRRGKPDTALQAGDVIYVPKAAINVYVGGEVTEPGMVPLEGNLTVLAAVLKAKGFKPSARLNNVIRLRDVDGKPQITKINLTNVAERGRPDLLLKPYDVVYVPKARITKADEFMERYFRQLLPVSAHMGFSYLLGPVGNF
jgi:protein involved in polysaccharide export with SLBB domain